MTENLPTENELLSKYYATNTDTFLNAAMDSVGNIICVGGYSSEIVLVGEANPNFKLIVTKLSMEPKP